MRLFGLFALCAALLLAGCASYSAFVEPGRNPRSFQRFFVKSNLNDNHGIDGRIALVLKSRGLQAETGPLTMMPRQTQAVVTFDDRWNWDFRNHLVYLRIQMYDPRSERPIATATFSGPAALTVSVDEAIERLIAELLDPKSEKKK